jgi:glycerol-3-phosphate dehydrogenase
MAKDVLDVAMKSLGLKRGERPKCPTEDAVLPGAVGLDIEAECASLIERGLDRDTAEWLVLAYGARHARFSSKLGERLISGMPFHWAEVDYAIEEEAATSVDDILIRRMPVYFEAPDQGLEVVESVADRLQQRLGWDDAHRAREVASYRAQVALSRRWKA